MMVNRKYIYKLNLDILLSKRIHTFPKKIHQVQIIR